MSILTTDASIFEIKPKDVLTPKTLKELKKSIKWLISQEEAFTIRGAGTSIAGQAIGSGYIVDISKHLDKIISFSKLHVSKLLLDNNELVEQKNKIIIRIRFMIKNINV